MTIERVEANYTGGGIYVFTGRLENGYYFIADNEYSVRIVNSDPDATDDYCYDEWQMSHLVSDLEDEEAKLFIQLMLRKIIDDGCNGNYNVSDMQRELDRLDNECGRCVCDYCYQAIWSRGERVRGHKVYEVQRVRGKSHRGSLSGFL